MLLSYQSHRSYVYISGAGVMKNTFFACLVIASFLGLSFLQNSSAEEDYLEKTSKEFANKIVTFYLEGPREGEGQILKEIKFKEIGGQVMITGKGVDTGQEENWTTGTEIGLRWNLVKSYYAMTPEYYEKKIKNRKFDY